MLRRADLPLDLRRRFLTGRPSLDLVHTGGEGELARWEIVHSPEDAVRWLSVILELDDGVLRARRSDLAALRDVRAAIWECAAAAVADRPCSGPAVAALNAAAAVPPLAPELASDGSAQIRPGTIPAALSTLARDAIDLFSGPLAGRVRECAADDCGLLFVDTSRPGRRRWCSMDRCGNRAKVRKHRIR